jgi:PAS domain S-box-containing protein
MEPVYLIVLVLAGVAGLFMALGWYRAHRRWKKSEHRRAGMTQVLEGSNDALFVIDFVNGTIVRANGQAGRMVGRSIPDLVGSNIHDLVPKAHVQASALRIADAWEGDGAVFADIPLLTAAGEELPVEWSARVVTLEDRPVITLMIRDIRERRALEQKVAEQQALVRAHSEELMGSMRYAGRIQRAVLPAEPALHEVFKESFVINSPRDSVGGDLFWTATYEGKRVLAVSDCTGHGVPGALLSLVGASLLEETLKLFGADSPAVLLNALRKRFIRAMNPEPGVQDNRDGMNIGLICLNTEARCVHFAGAYHPLWLVREGAVLEFKGDRMPIGVHAGEANPFAEARIDLLPGDRLYMFSDGMVDQFGGPEGKKLRSAGLRSWILESCHLPVHQQKQVLAQRFRTWRQGYDQVDDVLLVGVEFDGGATARTAAA